MRENSAVCSSEPCEGSASVRSIWRFNSRSYHIKGRLVGRVTPCAPSESHAAGRGLPSPYRHLCCLLLARQCAAEPFQPCRKAVPVLLAPHHGVASDPVELNHTACARERLMTMPRIFAAAERKQRPFRGRHFENHVFEI